MLAKVAIATDGNGEVTMRHMKKNYTMELKIACKRVYRYKTWGGMHTPGKLPIKSRCRPR